MPIGSRGTGGSGVGQYSLTQRLTYAQQLAGARRIRRQFQYTNRAEFGLLAAVIDGTGNFAFEIRTADNPIDVAVFQQEFAGLKSGRQLGAERGFDRAWAGKADQRFGLGKHQIAKRGEAG